MSPAQPPGAADAYIFGDRLPVGEVFEDASDAAWEMWMQASREMEARLIHRATAPLTPPVSAYDPPDRSLRRASMSSSRPDAPKKSFPFFIKR